MSLLDDIIDPTHQFVFRALDSSAIPARSNPGTVKASLPQKGSPHGDTGTAGVAALRGTPAYERFVSHLIDLLDDDKIDKARDVLRDEWHAIHGAG